MKKAYAMIVRNGLVLLVRKPGVPFWDLPGGPLRPDESEREGIKRIVREELGFESEIKELIGIYTKEFHEDVTYIYHGQEKKSQSAMYAPYYAAFDFFDLENPPLNLLPERRKQINDYLSGRYPVRIRFKENKYRFRIENFIKRKLKK